MVFATKKQKNSISSPAAWLTIHSILADTKSLIFLGTVPLQAMCPIGAGTKGPRFLLMALLVTNKNEVQRLSNNLCSILCSSEWALGRVGSIPYDDTWRMFNDSPLSCLWHCMVITSPDCSGRNMKKARSQFNIIKLEASDLKSCRDFIPLHRGPHLRHSLWNPLPTCSLQRGLASAHLMDIAFNRYEWTAQYVNPKIAASHGSSSHPTKER